MKVLKGSGKVKVTVKGELGWVGGVAGFARVCPVLKVART
jgi:hypothetical protein